MSENGDGERKQLSLPYLQDQEVSFWNQQESHKCGCTFHVQLHHRVKG